MLPLGVFLLLAPFAAAFNTFRLQNSTLLEIEAIHAVKPDALQTVHAAVPLSRSELLAADLNDRWFVPEQDFVPKLAYHPKKGWYLLDVDQLSSVKVEPTRRAAVGEQLNVSSLVRLASYTMGDVHFLRKGSLGAYVYNSIDKHTTTVVAIAPTEEAADKDRAATETQVVRVGNLAAYVFSETTSTSSDASSSSSNASLFWLLPAVAHGTPSQTARLHDGSLLVYFGAPRLVQLRLVENQS